MAAPATEPASPAVYRTPPAVRRALTVVAAVIALALVAQGTVSLLELAARHTTTEVTRYDGVTALVIDDASDVRLASAPAGTPLQVRARITEGIARPDREAVRGDDGSLRLSSSCPGLLGNSCSVDYELDVPAGTQVRVQTRAGDIVAQDLQTTEPVGLHSTAGDVTVIGVRAPELRVTTSAGDVRASGVRADRVVAVTSAGDIRLSLHGLAERLDAQTSAGDIDLVVPDTVYRVDTETSAGTVDDQEIRTSPDATRTITAATSAGDIRIEARR